MGERCRHEIAIEGCGTCLGILDIHGEWEVGAKFEAQYDGICADTTCHSDIREGDIILKWHEDDGVFCYTHEGCDPP